MATTPSPDAAPDVGAAGGGRGPWIPAGAPVLQRSRTPEIPSPGADAGMRGADGSGLLHWLPPDLRLLVLSRLGVGDLGALCATGHAYRTHADDVWRALCARRWSSARVSTCTMHTASGDADVGATSWRAQYGLMERAERALLREASSCQTVLDRRFPPEHGHILQSDLVLSASLAAVVCSGTQHNLWRASWAAGVAQSELDHVFVWQLPSGAPLPVLSLPSDPTGQQPPVVRARGSELFVARAAHPSVAVYECGGDAALAAAPVRELVGHTGAIKAMSVADDLIATGSEDSTVLLWERASGRRAAELRPGGGAVVEVQLVGGRLIVQHLCSHSARGSVTTVWRADELAAAGGGGGGCIARFGGWACLDPSGTRVYVQDGVELHCLHAHTGALQHALARPAPLAHWCASAMAASAAYVLSALSRADEESSDEEEAGEGGSEGSPGAHRVAVWRASDGSHLGTLDGLPWEPELLALHGHAAVCVAFDSPPPHALAFDLSALPGRMPKPVPISFHAPVVAAGLAGTRLAAALADGAVVLTELGVDAPHALPRSPAPSAP